MEIDSKTKVNSYLTFKIGNEEYGARVEEVKNILELQKITKIPKAPLYMKGVVNLRGKALPIIDTRIKFDMTPTEFTSNTCIVVMDLATKDEIIHIGALVDSVEAVSEINESIIESPPSIGDTYKSKFITGVAQINDSFIMILDLIKLFTTDELSDLKEIQTTKSEE